MRSSKQWHGNQPERRRGVVSIADVQAAWIVVAALLAIFYLAG